MHQNKATKAIKGKGISKGKRFVSLLLCFSMIMGFVPFGVFAPKEVQAAAFPGWGESSTVAGSNYTDVASTVDANRQLDGGYVAVGQTGNDGIISKYDKNNDLIWTHTVGSPAGIETIYAVDVWHDGTIIMVGETNADSTTPAWDYVASNGAPRGLAICYEPNGDLRWTFVESNPASHHSRFSAVDGTTIVGYDNPDGSTSAARWILNSATGALTNHVTTPGATHIAESVMDTFIGLQGALPICRSGVYYSEYGTSGHMGYITAIEPGPTSDSIAVLDYGSLKILNNFNYTTRDYDVSKTTTGLSLVDIAYSNGYYYGVDAQHIYKFDKDLNTIWTSTAIGGGATLTSISVPGGGVPVVAGVATTANTNPVWSGPGALVARIDALDLKLTTTPTPLPVQFGGTVGINARTTTPPGYEIETTEWFRVPVSDTTDYSVGTSFDSKYASVPLADKSPALVDPDTSDTDQTMSHQVDKNGKYWYKAKTTDAQDSSIKYSKVNSIVIDNIYTQSVVNRKGVEQGNTSNVFYPSEGTTMNNATPPVNYVTNKVGVAYDLNSTTNILNSTKDGVTKVPNNPPGTYAKLGVIPKDLAPYCTVDNSNFGPPNGSDQTNVNGTTLAPVTFEYTKVDSKWADMTVYAEDESGNPVGTLPHNSVSIPATKDVAMIETPSNPTVSYGQVPLTPPSNYFPVGFYFGRTYPGTLNPITLYDPDGAGPLAPYQAAVIDHVRNSAYTITFVYAQNDPSLGDLDGHVYEKTSTPNDRTRPIAGATVTTSSGEHATTDANGYYKIYDVPVGTHNVIASHANYNSNFAIDFYVGAAGYTQDLWLTKDVGGGGSKDTFIVQGTITDFASGLPLQNAAGIRTGAVAGVNNGAYGVFHGVDSQGNYVIGPFNKLDDVKIEGSSLPGHISENRTITDISADTDNFDFALRTPVEITVEGRDGNNVLLYSYKITKPYDTVAFNLVSNYVPGYKVVSSNPTGSLAGAAPAYMTVSVTPSGAQTITFNYVANTANVTVEAYDDTNSAAVPNFTPYIVPAEVGYAYTAEPPVIPGYTYTGVADHNGDVVVAGGNTIKFHYTKNIEGSGKYTVYAVDASDKTLIGSVERTLPNPTASFNVVDANAPTSTDIAALSGYTLVSGSGSPASISYDGLHEPVDVYYEYNKATQPITVNHYLKGTTTQVPGTTPDTTTYANAKAGERYVISAPAVAGYTVVGDTVKDFVLGTTTGDNVVNFYYEAVPAGKSPIEVVYYYEDSSSVKHTIEKSNYVGDTGSSLSFTAPATLPDGWTLSDTATKTGVFGTDTKLEFKYSRSNVNLDIKLTDTSNANADIPVPAGYDDPMVVGNGEYVVITAPNIPGKQVLAPSVKAGRYTANAQIEFKYKDSVAPTVDITHVSQVVAGPTDALVVPQPVPLPFAPFVTVEEKDSGNATVTAYNFPSVGYSVGYVAVGYQIDGGPYVSTYTPQVPPIPAPDINIPVDTIGNHTVTFSYKVDGGDGIPDEYQNVNITVKGEDNGTPLYEYVLNKPMSATPFNLVSNYVPGYKVVSSNPTGTLAGAAPAYMTVSVTPSGDKTITFEYDTNIANVTIAAFDDGTNLAVPAADFTPYDISAEVGYAYTAEPPVIPGYTYTGVADDNGDVVVAGGNTITFHYTKNIEGNGAYTVYAVDASDKTLIGSVERTLPNPTASFSVVDANAPTSTDIAALSGYTLVSGSGSPASISYDGLHEPVDVYYEYNRATQPITVNYYLDGTTTQVAPPDTTTYANAVIGERYIISAPLVAGHTAVGDTVKDFVLGTTTGDNVVNFYYTPIPAGQSSMEVVYYYEDASSVKHTIEKADYSGTSGTNLNYTAPATLPDGWTLSDTATKTGVFGTDTKLEFKYTRSNVNLDIKLTDTSNANADIPVPAGYDDPMVVGNGEYVVITAPNIPGKQVLAPSVKAGRYTADTQIEFKYEDSDAPTIDITHVSQVVAGPTDALVVPQPVPLPFAPFVTVEEKDSGNATVTAYNFPSVGYSVGYVAVGYQIDGGAYVSTYTPQVPPIPAPDINIPVDTQGNHTVTFSYKVDSGDGIPDEYQNVNITVKGEDNGTPLYEYVLNKPMSATPFNLVSNYVPGYKVVSSNPTGTLAGAAPAYMTVSVTPSGDKTITFEYDTNIANVTIAAFDDGTNLAVPAADFTPYDISAEVGYAYTAEPPVIPGYTYTGVADDNGDVVVAGGNTIKFHYTKNIEGNGAYTVYAVDASDKTLIGSVERTLPNPTASFSVVDANAPTSTDIAALSGYTLVSGSGSPASISYDGLHEPVDVYYEYNRATQPITVNYYLDGTTTQVAPPDTTTYANAVIGERYIISAPLVAGHTAVGDTVKDFVLGTTTGDNVVNFYYTPIPAGQSSMEVVYYYEDASSVKHTIEKADYSGTSGTNLNYTAPATLPDGWTLSDTATKTGVFGTDTKLEFKYTRSNVNLDIKLTDTSNANADIPVPAGYDDPTVVGNGEYVVITAPNIPGKQVLAPSVKAGRYTADTQIEFKYVDSDAPSIDITHVSQVVEGPTDALVVPQPVPLPFAPFVTVEEKNSGNATVTAYNFPSVGYSVGYVAVGYQIDGGPYVSTYTPQVPPIPATDINIPVDTLTNHTVTFSYKVDDGDGIPDEYENIDITVKGEDNGTPLYEYAIERPTSNTPFNLVSNYVPGYKVVSSTPTGTLAGTAPAYMTVSVTPSGDQTITFEYDTNMANVTVNAYDATNSITVPAADFTPYTVSAEIGYAYTAEPPVIPGYTYNGTNTGNGAAVVAGTNAITFNYTQNTVGNGAYTVYAVDDTDGTLIGSIDRTLPNPTALFNVVDANAPTSTDIAALSGYTLVSSSGSPASITYDGIHEPEDVYYRYTRSSQPITVNYYLDGTTTPVAPSDTTTYANAVIGERYIISAPLVAGHTAVGDTVKDFVLGTTSGDNVVNFYYTPIPAGQSSMEVVYYYEDASSVKHTIEKTDYSGTSGSSLVFTAPATLVGGWTLSDTATKTGVFGTDTKLEFKYSRSPVTLTIEHRDANNAFITPLPAYAVTSMTVGSGENVVVEAPFIPGYEVVPPSTVSGSYTSNQTITFHYTDATPATVDIITTSQVVAGSSDTPISPQPVPLPLGPTMQAVLQDGNTTSVSAYNYPNILHIPGVVAVGYQIDSNAYVSTYTPVIPLVPATDINLSVDHLINHTVKFSYKADVNGNGIPDEYEVVAITVKGEDINSIPLYEYVLNKPMSATPFNLVSNYVPGYKVVSSNPTGTLAGAAPAYMTVSVTPSGNQTITFEYDANMANVTVNAYDDGTNLAVPAADFTPYIVSAEVGYAYTAEPPVIPGYTYTGVADDNGDVVVAGGNTITFHYTKNIEGNGKYTVYAVDASDKTLIGSVERTLPNPTASFSVVDANAPTSTDIAALSGYTLVSSSGSPASISYDGLHEPVDVYYEYNRATQPITVNYYLDGTTTQVAPSDTTTYANAITGERYIISAPLVAGHTAVGDTVKDFVLGTTTGDNVVNFYYTPVPAGQSSMEVVYYYEDASSVKHTIEKNDFVGDTGSSLSFTAPATLPDGWTLSDTATKTGVFGTDTKLEFKYSRSNVNLDIKLTDTSNANADIPVPAGYDDPTVVGNGEYVVITAPNIPGKQVLAPSVKAGRYTADTQIEFKYVDSDAPSIDITHVSQVVEGPTDTLAVPQPVPLPFAPFVTVEEKNSGNATVTAYNFPSVGYSVGYVAVGYQIDGGPYVSTYTPQVPPIPATDINIPVDTLTNHTVTFSYKVDDGDGIPDEYENVDITVKGEDNGTPLYEYAIERPTSNTPFNLVSNYVPGYKVVSSTPTGTLAGTAPAYMTVSVTPSGDQTITFEYDTNMANVTVNAYDATNSITVPAADFTPYTVSAEIGYAYTAEPPVIPGYTYNGTNTGNGAVVAAGGNTITFNYTQNTVGNGAYTVYAVDDTDGTLIGSIDRTLPNPTALFNVVDANAPTSTDIAALSGYTLVSSSGSPASITYDGIHEPEDVYYRYTRSSQPITVNYYLDGTTTPVAPSDTTTYANAVIGERYIISAPLVAGHTAVGDTVKDFVLGTTSGDNVVNFYYTPIPAGQSSMEVVYYYEDASSVKHTIEKTDYSGTSGSSLVFTAPATLVGGWTLSDTATKTGVFGTDTKLEFKYSRSPVTLTIEHRDANNALITPLPAYAVTSMTVGSGENVVVEAPFIPGYEVVPPSTVSGSYTSNQTITFHYTDATPATVDIATTSVVVDGNNVPIAVQPSPLPLGPIVQALPQSATGTTVTALNPPTLGYSVGYVAVGYQIDNLPYVSMYTPQVPPIPAPAVINAITQDTLTNHTVTFSYMVDDGDGIPDEYENVDITVKGEDNGTPLYEYAIERPTSNTPFNLVSNYVPGYKVVSSTPTGTLAGTAPAYMTVSVTPSGDQTITFEYDTNMANVTVNAYDATNSITVPAADFTPYTVSAEIGYAYTAEPPVIPGYTYNGTNTGNGAVVAAGGNTITFNYTQNTVGNGAYTVYAVDDTDGTLIGSIDRTLPNPTALFNVVDANAPTSTDIAALSGYTLVSSSGSPASITYDGIHEPEDVYYRYTRSSQPITVNYYLDGTTTPVAPSDTTTYANAVIGERYIISAPLVAGHTAVGDTVKDFVLGTTSGDNVVNFYYTPIPAGQSSMEVVYYYEDASSVKHTIEKTDYSGTSGSSLVFTAPATLVGGWTLSDTATKTGVFGTDTKLEFKYSRSPVTLTIEHRDANNAFITPLPAYAVTSMTVGSGENVVVEAPFIPGYEVVPPSTVSGSYTSNQTITFHYTDATPATVDITTTSQVVAGSSDTPISPQPVPLPLGPTTQAVLQDGNTTSVSAYNYPNIWHIPGVVAVGYQIDSNAYVSTYTPVIPLVPATDINLSVDHLINHTVKFSYKADVNGNGIPDEYEVVDITVKGEDNGTPLYEYVLNKPMSATPFNLVSNYVPGYKVVSSTPTGTLAGTIPDYMTVSVTPSGAQTITFEYDTNMANVTVNAYDATNSITVPAADFTPYTVSAEIGYAYTAEPPVIPGYTYNGTNTGNGAVVAAGTNAITFNYTQNTVGNGAYTVYAVDDTDGTLIGSIDRTLPNPTALFNVVDANAPTSTDIAALSGYALVNSSGSPASITYDGIHEPEDVYYRYTRSSQPITVNYYLDGTTTPVAPSDTTTYANAVIGERYIISAPLVAGHTAVGDTVKDFVLGTTSGDNVVNFYYTPVPAGQSSMEVVYYYEDASSVKHTIEKTDYVGDTGSNLSFTAPATLVGGWTLSDTATKTGVFGTDTKLEFKYARSPVTLTIEHRDANNALITPLPANAVTSMTVGSGENVVVEAPFIPGYEVVPPSIVSGSYTSNQTIIFHYTDANAPTVDITTTSVVVDGNNVPIAVQPSPLPLGPIVQALPQSATGTTVTALNPPTPGYALGYVAVGYQIDNLPYVSMYTPQVPPIPAPAFITAITQDTQANHTVAFSYMVDDGDGIPDEYENVDITVKGEDNGTPLYEYAIERPTSNTPFNLVSNYVPGYKVVSSTPTGTLAGTAPAYMTVSVTPSGDQTITFEYDTNMANVTVNAYDATNSITVPAADFTPYTVSAEIGYAYTAEPPVIPGYTYNGTNTGNGAVVAAGGNTITFNYTQNTVGNGAYTVYAVDDTDGTLIGSIDRTLPNPTALFNVVDANAPTSTDIAALSGYALVNSSGSPASITYDGIHEPEDVYYRYTRSSQPITVNYYLDGTTTPVAPSDTTTYANAVIGERYIISAPLVAGHTAVGDTVKDFVLGTTSGDNVVNFYYTPIPAGQSSMEVVYYYEDASSVKHTIEKTDYSGTSGSSLVFTAPATLVGGWTLSDTATKTGVFGTDTKLEFKYTGTPVTLTIEHRDASNSNALITPLPANAVTSMTVGSGENVVVEAPFIPGYEVVPPSIVSGSYTSNQTITFYYTDANAPTVDITTTSVVVDSNNVPIAVQPSPLPLGPIVRALPQSATGTTVTALNPPTPGYAVGYVAVGYQIDNLPYVSMYTPQVPPIPAPAFITAITQDTLANHTVTFSYMVDDGNGIPDEYESVVINEIGIAAENNPPTPISGMPPLYNVNENALTASATYTVVPNGVTNYVVVGHKIDGGAYNATYTPQNPAIPVDLSQSNAVVGTAVPHTVEFYYKADVNNNLIPDEDEMLTITVITNTPHNGTAQYTEYEVPAGTDHVVYAPYMLDINNAPYVVTSRQMNNDPSITSGADIATQIIEDIQEDKVITFTYGSPLNPPTLHNLQIFTTTGTALDFTSAASIAVEDTNNVDAYAPMIDGYVVVYYEIPSVGNPFNGVNLTTAAALTPVNFTNVTQDERILFYYLVDGNGNEIPDEWEVDIFQHFESDLGVPIPGYPMLTANAVNFDSFTAHPPTIPLWIFESATRDGVPMTFDSNNNSFFTVSDQDTNIKYIYTADANGNLIPDKNEFSIKIMKSFDNGVTMTLDHTEHVVLGQSLTVQAPVVSGYHTVSYRIDGGLLVPFARAQVTLTNVNANSSVLFIYEQDALQPTPPPPEPGNPDPGNPDPGNPGGSGNPDPDTNIEPPLVEATDEEVPLGIAEEEVPLGIAEEEVPLGATDFGVTETFMKLPNKTIVSLGEYVDYTLKGIMNPYPGEVAQYSIGDIPPKGLTFVKGSIPSFENAEGVTYDVVYKTNFTDERIIASDLDATQPFYFEAPILEDGEYITEIVLRFNNVPVGFAQNNEIVYTFQVTEGNPGETLVNKGYISFRVGDEDFYIESGEGRISVSDGNSSAMTTKSNPKTGMFETEFATLAITLVAIVGTTMVFYKRRRNA